MQPKSDCCIVVVYCILGGPDSECIICEEAGDVSDQLMCNKCGNHYHASCLTNTANSKIVPGKNTNT